MKKFLITYIHRDTYEETVFKDVEARNWKRAKEMTDKKIAASKGISKDKVDSTFVSTVEQVNDKNTDELLLYMD